MSRSSGASPSSRMGGYNQAEYIRGGGELATVTPMPPASLESPTITSCSTRRPSLSSSSESTNRLQRQPQHEDLHPHSLSHQHSSKEKQHADDDVGNHAIILVMGVTGSGKSSFIDLLSNTRVQVGHSLVSCTTDPEIYTVDLPRDRRAYLIDTPGFDDTNRSDAEILRGVAFWLNGLYQQGKHISGLIYLHRITDVRMGGAASKNLELFRLICGREAYPHVALVSTMWEMLKDEEGRLIGENREKTLREEPNFWKEFVCGGAEVFRHDGSTGSACQILESLPLSSSGLVLDLQKEMGSGLLLDKTSAGIFLEGDLNKMKDKYESELLRLQKDLEEVRAEGDAKGEEILLSEQTTIFSKVADVDKGVEALNIDAEGLNQEKMLQYRDNLERQQRIELDRDPTLAKLFQRVNELEEAITDLQQRDKEKSKLISQLKRKDHDHVNGRRPSISTSPSTARRIEDLELRRQGTEAQIEDKLLRNGSPFGIMRWMIEVGARYTDPRRLRSFQRVNSDSAMR